MLSKTAIGRRYTPRTFCGPFTGIGGLGLLGWRRRRALRWGLKADVQSTFDEGGLTKSMG